MKTWRKFENLILTGEWHVHTNYTDGQNSVADYCKAAARLGIPLVAFTEHVREELDYDFDIFLRDIQEAKDTFDMLILSGCECKVLQDGSLDVQEWILREVDYPVFAFHSLNHREFDLSLLETIIRNKYVNAWAHPTTFFDGSSSHFPKEILERIFRILADESVLFEINGKYPLKDPLLLESAVAGGVSFVRGSDIHSVEELLSYSQCRLNSNRHS